MTIDDGEFVVIKGISGSGKSTLLSIMAGFMKPTSGLIEIDGLNIAKLSDYHASEFRHSKVGFVTQSFNLLERLSVRDNIVIPLIIDDLPMEQIEQKILLAMQRANIVHKAKEKVSSLSGGERQRCVIARAIVNEPDIVICDEPTANLDEENALGFIKIMQELSSLGKTVIIATHDPFFDQLDIVNKRFYIKEGLLDQPSFRT